MPISPSNSTVAVTYFKSDDTPVGTAEADGAEYALLTATILDGVSAPVEGAQVVFDLDATTPDPTANFEHGIAKPDGTNFASITDATGVATCRLRSQDAANSPLTVRVRAGEDNAQIDGSSPPTSSTVGSSPPHGTTLGATTVDTEFTAFTDTEFTGEVTILAGNCTFTNCTFDGATLVTNLVSVAANLEGVVFVDCTFQGSAGHAVTGNGMLFRRCYWTDIGLSAVNVSTVVQQQDFTTFEVCLIERVGRLTAAAAISAAPGYRVRALQTSFDCPHESSPNAVSGYRGRGVLQLLTRRPNQASTFVFEQCWVYGGGDYAADIRSLDTGNDPSAVRFSSCRWGDPAQYQNPSGALGYVSSTDLVGYLGQGNIADDTAALLAEVNNREGVGWYWPAEFLDVPGTVIFDPEPFPEAVVDPLSFAAPEATPIPTFSTAVYLNPDQATVPVNAARPLGEAVDTNGNPIFDDPYRDDVPTARGLFPPKARTGSQQPSGFLVQFAADDVSRSVVERDTTVNLTIESSEMLVDPVTVDLLYTGQATRGSDYDAPDQVVIPPGTDFVELPITIYYDTELAEDDEQIQIIIDGVSEGLKGPRDAANVTITNLPTPPALATPIASFSTTNVEITEGQTANLTIELHRTSASACDVDYVVDFTELSPSEYTDVTGGTVTIPAGSLTADVIISTLDDAVIENQEILVLRITNVTSGFNIGEQDTATVRVNDNDFVQVPEIEFTQATSNVLESSIREIRVAATSSVVSDTEVAFTETPGAGLTAGDYELVDRFGATVTSPLTIPAGQSVFSIFFEATDDALIEADETLTLELTSIASGNAQLGAQLTHVATILDDDTSGPGQDGDLYGLAPERQAVDLTVAEYDVFPNRFERSANAGLGISALTVASGGFYLARAISDAQVYWEALNAGNVAALQDRTTGLYTEGVTVRIRVHGDCDVNGWGHVKWSTDPDDAEVAAWTSPDLPIVRDIVIFGATDWQTDIVGHQILYDDFREDIVGGTYDGERRITSNIRFERISVEGNEGFQRNVGVVALSPAISEAQVNGFWKFYNTRFTNDRDSTRDRPQKWNIRARSITAGWDFRSCFSELALEHFVYVNSPRGGLYIIECTSERGGYSSTFGQSVNRRYDAGRIPGTSPYGTGQIVYMRNVIWDTSSDEELRGGADLTVQGQEAPVYFVENEHLGLATHSSGSGRRGAITCWSWSDYDPGEPGVSDYFDRDGFTYTHEDVHVWGDIVAWENGNGRATYSFAGCRYVDIRGFSMGGLHVREQIAFDKIGEWSGQSMRSILGEPARNGTFQHGVEWNLAWPNWNSDPYTGPISQYPGWNLGSLKALSLRSRRLANFDTENRNLSNSDLNVPFDGTARWSEGSVLPHARWQFSRIGFPVGGSIDIFGGDNDDTRSIREQQWAYSRTFENYNEGLYTETRNSVFTGGSDEGTMRFTYLDDAFNFATDERPLIQVTNTQTPPNSSQPGLIRYTIVDPGANAELIGEDSVDVFVYPAASFGTFNWDPLRYGSGGTTTIDLSVGGNQFVYLTTSEPTFMREEVRISKNPASTTPSIGFNSNPYVFAAGADERSVRLVNLSAASPGETLILDIDSVEVGGQTAGVIGSTSTLTITFV